MKRFCLLRLGCFPALAAGAAWQEPDDTTSLMQLSFAKQPNKGRRENVNVADQNKTALATNLAKMATFVSEVEGRHGDGDGPSGTDDSVASGNSDAEDSTGTSTSTSASGSWSADEQTALETLKSALKNQFTPFLDAEHAADVREYEARKAVHQLCMTHNVEDNDAVAAAQESTLETADKHRACRLSQKSWNVYRSLALSESSCAEASDILLMHKIYDNHEELATSMSAAKMHAQTYADLAPAGVKRDCAQDQQAYEEQWCAWLASKDDTCTQLTRCLDTVALVSLISDIEIRAVNRRMIWDTVIKLQCRIGHLLSTFTGSEEAPSADDTSDDISDFNTDDTCSEVTDTSKYVLSLGVPQQATCSDAGEAADDAIAPGGSTCSDWIALRFSAGQGWSPTTHVVPTTCQASCQTRTITAAPALHEGCAEDPPGCAFYNAHPDACGKYDTGSVVQSADCCACAPPPCDAIVDCSGHGATIDVDNTNGCDCVCDDGFEGADCATSGTPDTMLVVFDDFHIPEGYESRAGNSPGLISGMGTLNSDRWFAADDSVCGVSFKCTSASESLGRIGLSHRFVPHRSYSKIDYGITCNARGGDTTDAFSTSNILEGQVLGRPGNGNPATDVHAVRINADGQVEYSLNGDVYATSPNPVTYPWHAVADLKHFGSFEDIQYLQC